MRICSMVFLWMFFLTSQAFAVAPVDRNMISQAQAYGLNHAQTGLDEFLRPWTSYEEQAARLDDTAEQAYLYTPFLLVANDARAKKQTGKPISLDESEKIINIYADQMTFSVKLIGKNKDFGAKADVLLRQGKKLVKASYSVVQEAVAINPGRAKTAFMTQGYFYFPEADINLEQPVILSITPKDKKERRFYFNLAKIR